MDCNAQVFLVQLPQPLEDEFRLRARVDKDHTHPAGDDLFIDLIQRMSRHMTGPGNAVVCLQNINDRRDCLRHPHHRPAVTAQPFTGGIGLVDCGGQPDPPRLGCQRCKPLQIQAEKITTLVVKKGVQLVDDDIAQAAEIGPGVFI